MMFLNLTTFELAIAFSIDICCIKKEVIYEQFSPLVVIVYFVISQATITLLRMTFDIQRKSKFFVIELIIHICTFCEAFIPFHLKIQFME